MSKYKFYPINWSEGMVLMPEHLQQNDKRFDDMQQYRWIQNLPHSWGVADMLYEQDDLNNAMFNLLKCSAIMPDGQIINIVDGLSIDLKQKMSDLEKSPQKITLTVPQTKPNNQNNSYTIVNETINDDTEDVIIMREKPNVQLVIGEAPLYMISLPIAEVTAEGGIPKITDYMPPSIITRNEQILHTKCKDLEDKLSKKLTSFQKDLDKINNNSNIKKQFTVSPMVIRALFMRDLMQFSSVLQEFPHPYEIFRALVNLTSTQASIQFQIPVEILKYQHKDIMASCMPMIDFINSSLDLIHDDETDIPLSLDGEIFWIPKGNYTKPIVLHAEGDDLHQLRVWIENVAIASESQYIKICDTRTLGAYREVMGDRRGLEGAINGLLFEIQIPSQVIKSNERIALINKSKSKKPIRIVMHSDAEDPSGANHDTDIPK